jgi:hypothetical protein
MFTKKSLVVLLIIFSSCKSDDKQNIESNKMEVIKKNTEIDLEKRISDEDKRAYLEAKANVLKNKTGKDFDRLVDLNSSNLKPIYETLPYAFFLEKDLKDDLVYRTIFQGIINLSLKKSKPARINYIEDYPYVDKSDFTLALSYLEKGAALNFPKCLLELQELYRKGIGVKQDIKKADELKRRFEENMQKFKLEVITVN